MKPKLVFALLGLGLLVAILLPLPLSRYGVYLAALTLVYAIAAHGLNLTMGYAGQISIGHAAFFGIGAYSAGLLMVKLGLSFWLTLPVAPMPVKPMWCLEKQPGPALFLSQVSMG